jgi:hypothetical protein
MILLGLVTLGVAAYFGLTSSPWEPSGRGGAPAIVLSCSGLIVGIILIVLGVRGAEQVIRSRIHVGSIKARGVM